MEQDSHFRAYWFSIDPQKTHLLRFILEGYDNEFQMTTVDEDTPVIRILAMKGSEGRLMKILLDTDFLSVCEACVNPCPIF